MAPKQRSMGDTARTHHGRVRPIRQKTRGCDTVEQIRWKNQINWVHCESERIVAMSTSVNKHPIVLMSVYMPHSGYADHHVEKVYKTITKMIEGE